MPLRTCAVCPNPLPAGATARAKFCSPTCRSRAHRAGGAQLSVVKSDADERRDAPEPTRLPHPTSRLASLEAAAERLVRLLDEADPRSAAALNKEYRETLREIEALSAAGQQGGQGGGNRNRERRPFSPTAI